MIKHFLLLICCLLSVSLMAQEAAKIEFYNTTHDFGSIRPENGEVSYRFTFKNVGGQALKIDTVLASCGCTSPEWTQEAVNPGEEGVVAIVYDPTNRVGKFNKSLTVRSDAGRDVQLKVSGYVLPEARNPEMRYPVLAGNLRLEKKSVHLGNLTNEKPAVKIFEVYNEGDQIMIFPDSFNAPGYIKFKFYPEALRPKRVGEVHVIYDPDKDNDYGFRSDRAAFYSYDSLLQEVPLKVMAVLFPYIPPQSPEMLAKAPRIGMSRTSHNFKNLKEGREYDTKFELSNYGTNPLEIYQIKSNCECLRFEAPKSSLQSGESMTVRVIFDSEGRSGLEQKEIVVFTNDPKKPVRSFKVKAYVE